MRESKRERVRERELKVESFLISSKILQPQKWTSRDETNRSPIFYCTSTSIELEEQERKTKQKLDHKTFTAAITALELEYDKKLGSSKYSGKFRDGRSLTMRS